MNPLEHLVALCRETQLRYASAARVVGDPGLRLQFNHFAAARGGLLDDISRLTGLGITHLEPPPPVSTVRTATGQPLLGGEDCRNRLEGAALCELVRTLRGQDERMLDACHRARSSHLVGGACGDLLERVITGLQADLEKMRLLEDLAAGTAPAATPATASSAPGRGG